MIDDRATDSLRLHVAKWVVADEMLIENGAVATFGGRIVAAGPARELGARLHGGRKDHGEVVLCPALINAHSHLELSALKWRLSPAGAFVAWVRSLISARDQIAPGEWAPAVEEAVGELALNGVIAVGDVGNTDLIPRLSREHGGAWPLRGVFFREVIAPDGAPPGLGLLEHGDDGRGQRPTRGNHALLEAISAHAPYSVAPSVLQRIKTWASRRGLPFGIHVAESVDEVEFLRHGVGPIRELLRERGHGAPGLPRPGCSPVAYLKQLGLLDETTLCVHCVHVDEDDISFLAESRATVCLCPRSNAFLGVGIPPAERLRRAGVPLALGTDSLASNDRLSIFAEMSSLAHMAPGIEPAEVFAAATEGGARALGIEADWGCLGPGRAATFLAIGPAPARADEVMEYLVHQVARNGGAGCAWIRDGA